MSLIVRSNGYGAKEETIIEYSGVCDFAKDLSSAVSEHYLDEIKKLKEKLYSTDLSIEKRDDLRKTIDLKEKAHSKKLDKLREYDDSINEYMHISKYYALRELLESYIRHSSDLNNSSLESERSSFFMNEYNKKKFRNSTKDMKECMFYVKLSRRKCEKKIERDFNQIKKFQLKYSYFYRYFDKKLFSSRCTSVEDRLINGDNLLIDFLRKKHKNIKSVSDEFRGYNSGIHSLVSSIRSEIRNKVEKQFADEYKNIFEHCKQYDSDSNIKVMLNYINNLQSKNFYSLSAAKKICEDILQLDKEIDYVSSILDMFSNTIIIKSDIYAECKNICSMLKKQKEKLLKSEKLKEAQEIIDVYTRLIQLQGSKERLLNDIFDCKNPREEKKLNDELFEVEREIMKILSKYDSFERLFISDSSISKRIFDKKESEILAEKDIVPEVSKKDIGYKNEYSYEEAKSSNEKKEEKASTSSFSAEELKWMIPQQLSFIRNQYYQWRVNDLSCTFSRYCFENEYDAVDKMFNLAFKEYKLHYADSITFEEFVKKYCGNLMDVLGEYLYNKYLIEGQGQDFKEYLMINFNIKNTDGLVYSDNYGNEGRKR